MTEIPEKWQKYKPGKYLRDYEPRGNRPELYVILDLYMDSTSNPSQCKIKFERLRDGFTETKVLDRYFPRILLRKRETELRDVATNIEKSGKRLKQLLKEIQSLRTFETNLKELPDY